MLVEVLTNRFYFLSAWQLHSLRGQSVIFGAVAVTVHRTKCCSACSTQRRISVCLEMTSNSAAACCKLGRSHACLPGTSKDNMMMHLTLAFFSETHFAVLSTRSRAANTLKLRHRPLVRSRRRIQVPRLAPNPATHPRAPSPVQILAFLLRFTRARPPAISRAPCHQECRLRAPPRQRQLLRNNRAFHLAVLSQVLHLAAALVWCLPHIRAFGRPRRRR